MKNGKGTCKTCLLEENRRRERILSALSVVFWCCTYCSQRVTKTAQIKSIIKHWHPHQQHQRETQCCTNFALPPGEWNRDWTILGRHACGSSFDDTEQMLNYHWVSQYHNWWIYVVCWVADCLVRHGQLLNLPLMFACGRASGQSWLVHCVDWLMGG